MTYLVYQQGVAFLKDVGHIECNLPVYYENLLGMCSDAGGVEVEDVGDGVIPVLRV